MNPKGFVVIILVALALVTTLSVSGCTGFSCEDRSRDQLARCNTDCGEGLGSEICKSTCTSEHNQRLEQCREQPY